MFLDSFMQLALAMFTTSFTQEIHVPAPALHNPIHTRFSINETKYLYPIEPPCLTRPTRYTLDGFHLPFRNTGTCYFDTIYIEVLQQCAGNHQLLMRHKAHAIRLLAIAQRRIHYLYHIRHLVV